MCVHLPSMQKRCVEWTLIWRNNVHDGAFGQVELRPKNNFRVNLGYFQSRCAKMWLVKNSKVAPKVQWCDHEMDIIWSASQIYIHYYSWVTWKQSSLTLTLMYHKTAGYHRYILRFRVFVKKAFKKMQTFFFLEKTLSSSFFLTFPTFKVFWFFTKKTS